jgi:hypothetical protein
MPASPSVGFQPGRWRHSGARPDGPVHTALGQRKCRSSNRRAQMFSRPAAPWKNLTPHRPKPPLGHTSRPVWSRCSPRPERFAEAACTAGSLAGQPLRRGRAGPVTSPRRRRSHRSSFRSRKNSPRHSGSRSNVSDEYAVSTGRAHRARNGPESPNRQTGRKGSCQSLDANSEFSDLQAIRMAIGYEQWCSSPLNQNGSTGAAPPSTCRRRARGRRLRPRWPAVPRTRSLVAGRGLPGCSSPPPRPAGMP